VVVVEEAEGASEEDRRTPEEFLRLPPPRDLLRLM
jgi:hypothetical protein